MHPDKNGAPGADEAFKCAFSISSRTFDLALLIMVFGSLRSGVEGIPSPFWYVPGDQFEYSFSTAVINASCLLDPQKRAAFDRSGGDPEDRFGGSGMSSFFNQGTGRAGGASFDGEISPEELFNMFFGGGGFGGPGTTFSFGPGGPGECLYCTIWA